jgi:hypothetical protein
MKRALPGNLLRKLNRNLPVSVQPADCDVRRQGTLYGNIAERFLVLGGFAHSPFREGQEVIVRMVLEGRAVAYRTTVEHVQDRPKQIVFAAFPQEIAAADLRGSERISLFVPADVRAEAMRVNEPETLMLKTMIVNLSRGGCCLSAKRPVDARTEVSISFALPGETYVHSLIGIVLNRSRSDSVFAVRIRFPNVTGNIHGLGDIAKWVNRYAGYTVG